MLKKSFLIIVIFVSGILSCCTSVIPHISIDNFTIAFDDGNRNYIEEGTISTDSLYIQTSLDVEYLSSTWDGNPFVSTALAISCEPDGYNGLKDKMTGISFTSNQDFNNVEAGDLLNSIIVISNRNFILADNSLEGLIAQLNRFYDLEFEIIEFIITEKPTNNSTHKFTITMDFESGKNIVTTSKEITWN